MVRVVLDSRSSSPSATAASWIQIKAPMGSILVRRLNIFHGKATKMLKMGSVPTMSTSGLYRTAAHDHATTHPKNVSHTVRAHLS